MRLSLFAAAASLMLAAAPAAFAHAHLKASDPAAGAKVAPSISALLLTFTEAVQPKFCTVTVLDGMGMHAEQGVPQTVPGHPNELSVKLHLQMAGKYTVDWHALSVDTHKTHGKFSFTVTN